MYHDPTQAKAHFQLGTIRLEKKDTKGATDSFKATLKADPRYSEAWKAIGHIFFDNNSS